LKFEELSQRAGVAVLRGSDVMTGQAPKTASTRQGLRAFIEIEQSALDAIPTGLCVCRADGTLARYNRRAVTLWGRTPQLDDPSEIAGANFRRYTPQGAPLAFTATPVATTLRTGKPVVSAELVIERPDNTQIPVLMNVAQ
jgi:PAS domain-containing protein